MSKGTTISYSKVSTFKACPQKHYLTEEYKIELTSAALPFGNAVEAGVDLLVQKKTLDEAKARFREWWFKAPANYWEGEKQIFDSDNVFYYANDYDEHLITSEDEPKVAEWKQELLPESKETWDEIVGKFQGQVKNDSYIDPKERKFAHRIMWLCCLKRGQIMLEAFHDQLLPEIVEVIATQKWTSVKNSDGDKLVGKIDYIFRLKGYDKPVLTDLKTAGKFYTNHDLDTSDQLGIYAAAEKLDLIGYMVVLKNVKHERRCDKCDQLRENARKQKCENEKAKCDGRYSKIKSYGETQILVRPLRDGEAKEVLNDFSDVLLAMKNQVNWKNPGSCFAFNKQCEFYEFCWKGKPLDQLPGIKKKND